MSRRGQPVPEAAPVIGVVLAFGVAGFGLLFGTPETHLAVVALALALLYGFTAYGIVRSPDPASVIPPDPVLGGGVLLGGALAGYGVVLAQPMLGVLAGLVAVVPPVAYHARFGEQLNPLSPDRTLLVAVGLAVVIGVVGVLVADPVMGVLDGVVVVLAGADYRDTRGAALGELVEFTLVSVTLGGAALAVLYFTLVDGRPAVGLLAGGALVVVGAYFAIGERGRPGR